MQALQGGTLRVVAVLEAEAAAFVAFADQGHLRDALGAAEAVAAGDQFKHGGIA
ncbi:hypothetical protein D3C72_2481790 [compost metagenome]